MRKYIFLLFWSLLFFLPVVEMHAQDSIPTTRGKDFWLSFGRNFGKDLPTLQIRMSATKKTTVILTFTSLNSSTTITIEPNTTYTYTCSLLEAESLYSKETGRTRKSLHIQSDEFIAVYAINLALHSVDATAVLPATALGRAYYHLSYTGMFALTYSPDGYTLVAIEDNTPIFENNIFLTVLNKGEVYSKYFEREDATGICITSDKPIAYFVTNESTRIPMGTPAGNCLYEQLLPIELWGTIFVIPSTKRGKERIRVIASANNTEITQLGGYIIPGMNELSTTLNVGEYLEFEISENGCYIKTNKPVAVGSYLISKFYTGLNGVLGEAAITWVPPIEQKAESIILSPFITAETSSCMLDHYATLVVPTQNKMHTTMRIGDGPPNLIVYWTDLPVNNRYSYCSIKLTEPDSTYYFENPGGLYALAYGLGDSVSYYYMSSALNELEAAFYINDIHYLEANGTTLCYSKEVFFEAATYHEMSSAPGHLRWFINGVEDVSVRDSIRWKRDSLPNGINTITLIVNSSQNKLDTLTSIVDLTQKSHIVLYDSVVCYGENTKLSVKNPDIYITYKWYDSLDTLLATGTNFTTQLLKEDTVFYMQAESPMCINIDRSEIFIKVHKVNLLTEELAYYNSDIPYSAQLVSDAAQPFFSIYDGELPPGITMDSTGLISGTVPESAGAPIKTFSVKVTDKNTGCVGTKRYILRSCAPFPIFPDGDSINYCLGDKALPLNASSTTNLPLQWYAADRTTKLSEPPIPNTETVVKQVYYVAQINSTLKCEGPKARMVVEINPLPQSNFNVSANNICYGDLPMLALNNLDPTYTYAVYSTASQTDSLGQLKNSTSGSITINRNPSANVAYYIQAVNKFGCSLKELVPVDVKVTNLKISPPKLPAYRNNIMYSQQLQSNAESNAVYSLVSGYFPVGLSFTSSGLITGKVPLEENFKNKTFTVQVEDAAGCTATQEYTLLANLAVPKVFTPNGDGINDYFMVGYKVLIFDRLGNLIYEGDDGWDGTYKGQPAPVDIYFYKLYQKDGSGKTEIKTGYIGLQK